MKRNTRKAPIRWGMALALMVAWLLGGLCTGVQAQDPVNVTVNQVNSTRFPEVVTYVTVSDNTGHAIGELPPEAFSLAEDGAMVDDFAVERMENVGEPILLALVLDTSGSMQGTALRNTKAAAVQLINDLGPADQVAVLSFDTQVTTEVDLTAAKEAAALAVEGLTAKGDTALYEAIYEGVKLLTGRPRGRKALVVLTDGADTDSALAVEDAVNAAKEAGVPVYAIGFGASIQPAVLERVAILTGGHFYQSPNSEEIGTKFEAVARLLRTQYVLRFTSSLPADGAEHTLRVAVEVEGVRADDQAPFTAVVGEVAVEMQSPIEGETVGGLVVLKPHIQAPGEVMKVEYLLDGEPLATATTGEFAYEWDATAVPLGEHILTVRAIDSAGNTGQTELILTVVEPIVVSFLTPTGARPVSGDVPVEVEVSALAGVAQVKFAVDGKETETVTAPPWGFAWDTTGLDVVTHTLTATAYDAASQSAQASLDVWVGMRLALRGLGDGDAVGGLWTLEPDIVAPGDPVQVEYLLDGAVLARKSTGNLSYNWDASAASPGQHTLTMRVADTTGNEGALDLTLMVTEPVQVAFISPPEEDLKELGREVEVQVDVASLWEIDRVEFAVDGGVVETVESEPYRFLWDTTGFATGEHELSAVAYDSKGQSDRASLNGWVAFRGSSWGLWAVLAILLIGGGLMVPLARRRRGRMVTPGAAPARSTAGPVQPGASYTPAPPKQPARAAGAPVAWLVVEGGPEVGRRWPVPPGETSLGRTQSLNDIVTPSRTASRRHAVIRAGAEGCTYYDLEPTNPTLINGKPIVGSHELAEGDRIRIGDLILRFTEEGMR